MNKRINAVLIFGLLYGSAVIAMDNTPVCNRKVSLYTPQEIRADEQEFESLSAEGKLKAFIKLKSAHQELLDKVQRLEEENKSISQFLAGRAHQSKSEKTNHKTDLIVTGMGVALVTALATATVMILLQNKSISSSSKQL